MGQAHTDSAEQFAQAYARRSGTTVEQLKAAGREVRPCDCGDAICEGWQMAHIKELQWAVDQGIATSAEDGTSQL